MTRHFCTYFDRRYLPNALALIDSLRRHCRDFRLWALCLDDAAHAALAERWRSRKYRRSAWRSSSVATRRSPRRSATGRRSSTTSRARRRCRCSCSGSRPQVDAITYLDADLFFFSDPAPLFEEIGSSAVAIIPHRFPAANTRFERYGIFNVGWLTFRRSDAALACLTWWRERCLEWCFDREEPSRFADQKYLDDWPSRFEGVHVVRHKGANVASWNLANYDLTRRDGKVFVDDEPLIFFHFHHLKRRRTWLFETDFAPHGARLNRVLKEDVFTPYCRLLDDKAAAVARRAGHVRGRAASPDAAHAAGGCRSWPAFPTSPRQSDAVRRRPGSLTVWRLCRAPWSSARRRSASTTASA